MSSEIEKNSNNDGLEPKSESLPAQTPNRIMIFGSRNSGAQILGKGLLDYLKDMGIENLRVIPEKDADYIPEGFYGLYRNDDGSIPERSIPRGVILMPEMRAYAPSGTGMFVPTYQSNIPEILEKLCSEHDVPLIKIYENTTLEEIETRLASLNPSEQQAELEA